MEDSPRSSKRRKLGTPNRTAASLLAKSTLRKSSARVASRTTLSPTAEIEDGEEDVPTPTRRSTRTSKAGSRGAEQISSLSEEVDVFDDIDGALPAHGQESRVSRARRSTVKASAKPIAEVTNAATPQGTPKKKTKYKWDPSMPHPFKSNAGTPTKAVGKENTAAPESAGRFRSLVDGHRNDEGEKENVVDVPTPKRRGRPPRATISEAGSPVKAAVSSPAKKPVGRPRKAKQTEEDGEDSSDPLQEDTATPAKTRSSRRPVASVRLQKQAEAPQDEQELITATPTRSSRRRAPVLDSEDELGDRDTPSRAKQAQARRRANRADHTHNEDDSDAVLPQVEEVNAGDEDDDEGVDEDNLSIAGNSIAGSILDPTEPSPFNVPTPVFKKVIRAEVLQGTLEEGPQLHLLKTIAMDRITGRRSAPVVGLDDEYKSVHQLVEHTITAGEGNSMLLIGARGSGKTALVNKVLSEISKDNAENYHVVRLNGFIHTDDKIALREIWRQLGKEMDIEEDSRIGKNYADTLTTLLALLSHPSEQTGELTDQVARAVIFVMDEFDLFALHPRQTLLYNLFDIAQSRKAPIAVLGLTTRIDVANSLEKRVKSRFSHRYVHLSLPKTFSAYQDYCKASLIVKSDQLTIEERAILCGDATTTPGKKDKIQKSVPQDSLVTWNANIESLFSSKSFLTTHLAPHFYLTKSVPVALTTLLLPIAQLSASKPLPTAPSSALTLSPPDSKLSLLPSLSTLALALLIAACRLDIIHDSDTCNFNMAYDEYVTLASKARSQSAAGGLSASGSVSKVWGKEVARREWEGLVDLGLIVPVVLGQGFNGGFGMCRCDVRLEEVGVMLSGEKGVEKALERWCRQL